MTNTSTEKVESKAECEHDLKEIKVERDYKYNPKYYVSYLVCRICKMAGIGRKDL